MNTSPLLDLLGDPVPPTPAMTDPLPMRVFRINDCDWWMARTSEDAKASYLEILGPMPDDEAFDDPHELSDAELDRLMFVDVDDHDQPLKKTRRTFREELQRRIDAGVTVPEMFASTEY
jgi:hypothetical protein